MTLLPNRDGIPPELLERDQWVTHLNKRPYSVVTDEMGGYKDSDKLVSYDDACRAAKRKRHDGVGFATLASDPYTLIDVDHCVRPTGDVAPLVGFWLGLWGVSSYVEYSHGEGVHSIVRGELPGEREKFTVKDPTTGEQFMFELYDCDRYFRITGRTMPQRHIITAPGVPQLGVPPRMRVLPAMPTRLIANQAALDKLYWWLDSEDPHGAGAGESDGRTLAQMWGDLPAPRTPEMTDEEVLRRASETKGSGPVFNRLFYKGDITGYPSHSEADAGLLRRLRFWTQRADQLDRLFRRSKLMRPKWDKVHHRASGLTYGQMSITRVLCKPVETPENPAQTYSPPVPPRQDDSDVPAAGGDAGPWQLGQDPDADLRAALGDASWS